MVYSMPDLMPSTRTEATTANADGNVTQRELESVSSAGGGGTDRGMWVFLLGLTAGTLLQAKPWLLVIQGALVDRLYSYVLLIPFICGWLIWQNRPASLRSSGGSPVLGGILAVGAILLAYWGISARTQGVITGETSWLTTQIGAWVIYVWALALGLMGRAWVWANAFALGFLVFTVPMPDPMVANIERSLQFASADMSDWMFSFAGTPYIREGGSFWFPNLHIEVAPECSGIRSTLVLFITGILGSHLLLRQMVHRCALVASIVPLGILRNGIRILTLTMLSVHVDPRIMTSALHRRGGPLFFAVSLIPLFVLIWWLVRRERRINGPPTEKDR